MSLLKNLDFYLIFSAIIIFLLGCLTLFSIDPLLAKNQLIFFLIGFLLFVLVSKAHTVVWSGFANLLYVFSLATLVLTFIIGRFSRGAYRWLEIWGLSFQPSEVIKPFLIIFFSWLVSRFPLKEVKNVVIQLGAFFVPFF